MNRRLFLHTSISTAVAVAVLSPALFAADGKIGMMSPADFTKINKDAGAKLAAIKPTADKLSEADGKLLTEVALGGMMQLEMSKLAVKSAQSADVRAYAQAEVEEQTGLSAKLAELVTAKGGMLPTELDAKGKKMVEKLQAKSGAEFDKDYVKETGVDGHQLLNKTMEKVKAKAADATLKEIAMTALPLIQTHLQVAKDELKDI